MPGDIDPVFSALENLRRANAECAMLRIRWQDAPEMIEQSPLIDERLERLEALYSTEPTTLHGLAALVEVFLAEDFPEIEDAGLAATAIRTMARSIVSLAVKQSGATWLPTSRVLDRHPAA